MGFLLQYLSVLLLALPAYISQSTRVVYYLVRKWRWLSERPSDGETWMMSFATELQIFNSVVLKIYWHESCVLACNSILTAGGSAFLINYSIMFVMHVKEERHFSRSFLFPFHVLHLMYACILRANTKRLSQH